MEEHNHDHAAHHEAHEHKKEKMELTVPGAIVLNGLIIACAIIIAALMMGGHFSKSADTDTRQEVAVNIANVKLDNQPYIGSTQAPVVIAYWSDYQCPFCKLFETTTMQTLITDYVKTGKLAIVFKDFAFLGNDSTIDAIYARAVWDLYPDNYFAWREAMFNKQDGENAGFGDEASVKALTATIDGIDAKKVAQQVSDNLAEYQRDLQNDRAEADSMGIQGTPAFVTGKISISGNKPLADFVKAIDAQLKK